jgi:hypothetical protein
LLPLERAWEDERLRGVPWRSACRIRRAGRTLEKTADRSFLEDDDTHEEAEEDAHPIQEEEEGVDSLDDTNVGNTLSVAEDTHTPGEDRDGPSETERVLEHKAWMEVLDSAHRRREDSEEAWASRKDRSDNVRRELVELEEEEAPIYPSPFLLRARAWVSSRNVVLQGSSLRRRLCSAWLRSMITSSNS